MRTAHNLRIFIARLQHRQIFTTRDLLYCGPRGAIDQYLYRQVKNGLLTRLARGVFIRSCDGGPPPSAQEIARIKAEAFGKQIIIHAQNLFQKFRLDDTRVRTKTENDEKRDPEILFCVSGCSSRFKYGQKIIKLTSASPKTLKLGDDITGQLMRLIALCGKRQFTLNQMNVGVTNLMRPGRENIPNMIRWTNQWTAEHFRDFCPPNRPISRVFRLGG